MQYLDVCRGRTDPFFCASGNETEMKLMDQTVRATLKSYAEGGYRCSSAMAELQCRLTFPAVHSMADKRILPVNYASCVKLFMPCLGTDEAEELCRGASSGGASRGYAGIAAAESPWATTTMPTLYQAEHTAEEVHTKCTGLFFLVRFCPVLFCVVLFCFVLSCHVSLCLSLSFSPMQSNADPMYQIDFD